MDTMPDPFVVPWLNTSQAQFISMKAVYIFTIDLYFHLIENKRLIYTIQLICVQIRCSDRCTIEMKIH